MFKKNFRVYEHLHIPIWLVKDTCWALSFKTLGVAMIFPTLLLAIVISIKTRKNKMELLPNLSIAFWITANSIWMCDEFFELNIKEWCYVPFIIGLVIISFWTIFYLPKLWKSNDIQS